MLSDRSQTQKKDYMLYDFIYVKCSERPHFKDRRQISDGVGAETDGKQTRGNWGVMEMSKTDYGGGCTIL